MIEVMGFLTPFIVYLCITLLHFFLPGRWVVGYVDNPNTGQKLRYRLNGRLVLLASIGLWYTLGYLGWVSWDWLYEVRWFSLAVACVICLVYSLASVLPYPSTCRSFPVDFFL